MKYLHSTNQTRMEDTLKRVNGLARSMQRSVEFVLSHKTDEGYTVSVGPREGEKQALASFPNKRLVHAFLNGVELSMSLLVRDQSVSLGYEVGAVRESFFTEREFCPSCGEDLTNRVKWECLRTNYSLGRCPKCKTEVMKQDLRFMLRLFSVARPVIASTVIQS